MMVSKYNKKIEYILFITEGEKTEKLIIENIDKNFFNLKREVRIISYQTNIYTLFKNIMEEIDYNNIDLVGLIKERLNRVNANRKDIEDKNNELKEISRDNISQIFLFFDYDGHTSGASDDKVREMLRIFNNETEYGKLYISYPMVEATKHLKREEKENIENYIIAAKEKINYKNIVSNNTDFQNFTTLEKEDWEYITSKMMSRLFYLFTIKKSKVSYKYYLENMGQDNIFEEQFSKFIKNNKLLVLGAFPFFIVEYFGKDFFERIIK